MLERDELKRFQGRTECQLSESASSNLSDKSTWLEGWFLIKDFSKIFLLTLGFYATSHKFNRVEIVEAVADQISKVYFITVKNLILPVLTSKYLAFFQDYNEVNRVH